MIILDTNVVSEAIKLPANQSVLNWLNEQDESDLFLTAISVAELRAGAEIMPDGRRKRDLQQQTSAFLSLTFGPRLLAFDVAAAEAYASIFAKMRNKGRGISTPDCQIAAIARAHGFAVASRDVQPFRDAGLSVINPWQEVNS
jgi:predicted nucleic acid-binding protein